MTKSTENKSEKERNNQHIQELTQLLTYKLNEEKSWHKSKN